MQKLLKHHQDSIEKLKEYFAGDESVLAIILDGSIVKGQGRPDSDIDAIVVVTRESYRERERANRLSECITGYCTYEGGYFDLKYCCKDYLRAAAERGSEPTRNAFLGARVIVCRDGEIPGLVARIGVFQEGERAEKLLSFYSALDLYRGYFWDSSRENRYLRVRAAAEIVLYGYRLLLEEAGVLFPCQKSLPKAVAALDRKPEGIEEKAQRLLDRMDDGAMEDFVQAILAFIDYRPPADYAEVLTRFVDDNEQWWLKDRPVLAEW